MLDICNFAQNISQIKQGLLLSGDDEFLKEDACTIYINYYKNLGHKIKRLDLNTAEDWLELPIIINHKSFFSESILVICNLNQKSLTKAVEIKFTKQMHNLPNNIRILFVSKKANNTLKKSNIFKNFTTINIWPLKTKELINWTNSRVKYLGIKLSSQQIEQTTIVNNSCPMEISNALKIAHASNNPELAYKFDVTKQSDCWAILDSVMSGNKTKILENKTNDIQLLHATIYCIKNVLNILTLTNQGMSLNEACQKVIKWPRQQTKYQRLLMRRKDWSKIAEQTIQLEIIFKQNNNQLANMKLQQLLIAMAS